jgi:zinc transporter, ZIP family
MAESLLAGSSLVLGGLLALWLPIERRVLGLTMAFGAGVLLGTVAFELVYGAQGDFAPPLAG